METSSILFAASFHLESSTVDAAQQKDPKLKQKLKDGNYHIEDFVGGEKTDSVCIQLLLYATSFRLETIHNSNCMHIEYMYTHIHILPY
jgi:hypothetical protein